MKLPEKADIVFVDTNNQIVTSSLIVAQEFEKEHKNVLQTIKNLMAQNCAVRNMFVENTYVSGRGRDEPMFVMSRDGFSLLVMGFTGDKALKFKLDFIEAFNKMEEKLKTKAIDFSNPDTILQLAQSYKDEYERRLLAEKKIEEDRDKVYLATAVSNSFDVLYNEIHYSHYSKIIHLFIYFNFCITLNSIYVTRYKECLSTSNKIL